MVADERLEEVVEGTREADWISVRNEAGASGLVPRAYVDSLASSPAGQSTGSGSGAGAGAAAGGGWASASATAAYDPNAVAWDDEPAPEPASFAPRAQQQSPQRSPLSAMPSASSAASASAAAPKWAPTQAPAGDDQAAAGDDVYANLDYAAGGAESLSAAPASRQPLTTSDSSRSLDTLSALSKFNIVKVCAPISDLLLMDLLIVN